MKVKFLDGEFVYTTDVCVGIQCCSCICLYVCVCVCVCGCCVYLLLYLYLYLYVSGLCVFAGVSSFFLHLLLIVLVFAHVYSGIQTRSNNLRQYASG